jgi:hypothetical protein
MKPFIPVLVATFFFFQHAVNQMRNRTILKSWCRRLNTGTSPQEVRVFLQERHCQLP